MEPETRDLINRAIKVFAQTTGMKAAHQVVAINRKGHNPDGQIRIEHQGLHWDFAVEVKRRLTRAAVVAEKVQPAMLRQDFILVTEYVTPPIADLMKEIGLPFMDTAGNVYLNKPPLYVFIKGNKPPGRGKTAPAKRLFKPAGLKVVFALLNLPEMVNLPYRRIAAMTDVALGTVDWIFRDLKDLGFLIEMGRRQRTMTNQLTLLKRWVEAYPDQLRPKLAIARFQADNFNWWKDVDIKKYDACWGGEVAAAMVTKQLKPEKVVIYANETPGKLIIGNRLRKDIAGDVEILKPFWKFDHEFLDMGAVPPLLVYADLVATGDYRNIEIAGYIYDHYLAQPDLQDR